MEWGIAINLHEHVSKIIKKAIIADKGAIDTVWITDYPATRFAPALASVIARNTDKCRIGVGLLSPLIYSTSHIIQMMTTLIDNYGEKFDLLLGPGDRLRLQNIGVDYGNIATLVTRLSDSASEIREALGDYDARIFMGAQGQKMVAACTCSDGVLLNYSDPDMIEWAISNLGEREKKFKIGIFPPSLIGSSARCNEHTGINRAAAVVALGLNPSIIRRFGLGSRLQPAITKMRETGITDEIVEMIDQDILSRFYLCGSIDAISKQIERYQQCGVEMIVYGPPLGASIRGVKSLVDAKSRN